MDTSPPPTPPAPPIPASASATSSTSASASSSTAAPEGVAEPPMAPTGRKDQMPRPISGDSYTVEEARAFLPRIKGCAASLRNAAWEMKFSLRVTPGPKSHTVTWGGLNGITHAQALVMTLQWVWQRATEYDSSVECPFDLDTALLGHDCPSGDVP